jgi:predicted dehydrogenase
MSKPYRVVVVGAGKRGLHHAAAFKASSKFELVGLSDVDQGRLDKVAPDLGNPQTSTNAAALAKEVKPDLFCFCTPPNIRLELIKIGVDSGAKLIAYEKPIALSTNEGLEIRKIVNAAGVKTVVSHQHRYGTHYAKVAEIAASGALGRIQTVYAHAPGWMTHMISHFIDLARLYNGNVEAQWVMAQAAGRNKLSDNHPSPDYISGVIHFANGVRGYIESGAGAQDVPEVDAWWRKNRVGVQGTNGFAEALTGGGWRAVTGEGVSSGPGSMNYDLDMPPYVADMAAWLDDDSKVHPCNGENAYKSFEITMGLVRSVIERGQIALPLGPGEVELEGLRRVLPERPVLLGFEGTRKEYFK